MAFDPRHFRAMFPALDAETTYLDSAATALKPLPMIIATDQYYRLETSSHLRSNHSLGMLTTTKVATARSLVRQRLNAQFDHEIIWTKGATESLNIIAQSYARQQLQPGDEIIVSEFEHHSNLIPWLQVAKQTGAKVIKWPAEKDLTLSIQKLEQLLTTRTKIVAVTQMSNVTGYQPDLATISRIVHQQCNAKLIVDGAQGMVHYATIDVIALNIDFYVFSAHKLYGPTGLGVLYGKSELLEHMDIWQGGGKMIEQVSFDDFTIASLPDKYEAGTQNIAGILGFLATLNWLNAIELGLAHQYTQQLCNTAKQRLQQFKNANIYSGHESTILTFSFSNIHHDDIAILLAEQKIAIRAGKLCAHPLIASFATTGVLRVSFMPYNNLDDVDAFFNALEQALIILDE